MQLKAYFALLVVISFLASCKSDDKSKKRTRDSLIKQYETKAKLENYNTIHDSLALFQEFKKESLELIDSIRYDVENLREKYKYEFGQVPDKLEFSLMRLEERANDLRSKIKRIRIKDKKLNDFKIEVENEIRSIREQINKL